MKPDRAKVVVLEDIPNVGKSVAGDLRQLGIRTPCELAGRDPYALYEKLNRLTRKRHDPCLLDTFIAAVDFMQGAPATPWWQLHVRTQAALAAHATRRAASR